MKKLSVRTMSSTADAAPRVKPATRKNIILRRAAIIVVNLKKEKSTNRLPSFHKSLN